MANIFQIKLNFLSNIDHKSSLKSAYFQKAVTLFHFVIVMENLYSTHNICRTLLLFYLGQIQICEVILKHCSHMEWGPKFFKMGTQWGPQFE